MSYRSFHCYSMDVDVIVLCIEDEIGILCVVIYVYMRVSLSQGKEVRIVAEKSGKLSQ
jgi:hypothetical protein